jgi:hypothetical protein
MGQDRNPTILNRYFSRQNCQLRLARLANRPTTPISWPLPSMNLARIAPYTLLVSVVHKIQAVI